ncbi:hypothetical protein [Panacibacter microcysteis]|nr:hypothetical protein [Panacibacter microcysteis]
MVLHDFLLLFKKIAVGAALFLVPLLLIVSMLWLIQFYLLN